jgi:hypothetical protein
MHAGQGSSIGKPVLVLLRTACRNHFFPCVSEYLNGQRKREREWPVAFLCIGPHNRMSVELVRSVCNGCYRVILACFAR